MEQQTYTEFLPISRADMEARGWEQLDFVVVGGDAYVDHPSFGTAIISRLLEAEGYKVGVLAQPRYTDCEDFKRFGKPKYGFFIGGGNVDSMVSHYSVAKIPRAEDEYSPGGKAGARPDRSATVYTKLAKQAYPDLPVILGGLEASLRRFAHYDYWLDTVLPSIAEDSGADLISFGMGEHQTVEIARRLAAGEPVETITDVNGTCYLTDFDHLPQRYVECAGFKKVASDKTAYAKACRIQMDNQDVVSGQIIVQKQSEKYLVQNIPAKPLVRWELDKVYALPYTRRYHPIYEAMGGVPAIREVQFSIIQNRGCFGGCNFCAIQLHQGRRVTSRSADSIVEEAERMTHEPDFKGYIHDVGGPTANFRFPSCREQMLRGMCTGGKHCLAPTTCSHMIVDHSDYLKILRRVRELPGVKKVFIRSGIRFDYLMADPDDTFFKELVEYHVSGQLKVAPEHCAPNTLAYMGKPPIETFNKFKDKFYELSKKAGKKQYLVPYLMSSHPGSTLSDAVYLAEYLYKNHMRPEQVQDFYPTPGTVSTCMFYTGLDPYTLKPVFVEKTAEELICEFVVGGAMRSRKSVNVPSVSINLPSVTEKDRRFIEWAVKNDVDFIAHSFVRSARDIKAVQDILDAHGSKIKIISKIENREGLDNIDEIIEASYGIMVARGDLGVELPAEAIPNTQRRIVEKCICAKRPVIIATQMLYSMVKSPRPTRAEVSDVASAIYERVDAVMLSDETAMGDFPVESVETMARIAREIERDETHFKPMIDMDMVSVNHEITAQLARSAVRASTNLPIKYVVLDTKTGRTGRYLAAFRGQKTVMAVCYQLHAQRILALSYGVVPILRNQELKDRYHFLIDALEVIEQHQKLDGQDLLAIVGGSFGPDGGASYVEIANVLNIRRRNEEIVAAQKS